MLDKLNFRQKNRLTLAAAILLIYMIYSMAIKKTVVQYNDYKESLIQMQKLQTAPAEISRIRSEIKQMESAMNMSTGSKVFNQEKLLEVISSFSQKNDLVIREFPEREVLNQNDLTIETALIKLEGRYTDMVKMIYLLEEEKKYGRIASAGFVSVRDPRTKKTTLNSTLYFQVIKK